MLSRLKTLFGTRDDGAEEATPLRPRVELARDIASIYVVPDIHGCYDELLDAEKRIYADAAASAPETLRQIIYLGDYVDRGPRSADVIEHLIGEPQAGFERICLCGNHDDVMCQFMIDPDGYADWLRYGGDATLLSYGINVAGILRKGNLRRLRDEAVDVIPARHLEWLSRLPVVAYRARIIFAHAGIRPGIALEQQSDEDLMWIREPFLTEGPGEDLFVVHGHTIAPQVEFVRKRIGLDTGAYLTGKLEVLKITKNGPSIL